MSQGLNTTIKGVSVDESLIQAALGSIPSSSFDKDQFADALSAEGLVEAQDPDLVRRLMQFLKRRSVIRFDAAANLWIKLSTGPAIAKTLSPQAHLSPATFTPLPFNRWQAFWDHIAGFFRLSLAHIACLGLIAALIALNASFAWELGGEREALQIALVIALVALDLMRPILIAAGLWFWDQGKVLRAVLAVCLTLSLSPVSVLSSTVILSASFLLGAELNTGAQKAEDLSLTLRAEHSRLLARADDQKQDWRDECARGGCGPRAEKLEEKFRATVAEAKQVLNRILELDDVSQNNSKLIARMVTSFETLGLFTDTRQLMLPLLLALSLELGALFGPALLLHRRRP